METSSIRALRGFLLILFLIGTLGTGAELLLLEHFEDVWQYAPLILMVPGVGDRMAHEFEEYRPYQNIEQFRREIGKYVDEDEVARLERYVTLN